MTRAIRGKLEVCMVCGQIMRILTNSHMLRHDMTVEMYDEKYERVYVPMRPQKNYQREYVEKKELKEMRKNSSRVL